MVTTLKLSSNLKLPADFATEGVAVLGMRGSGKSNTEARYVELLYAAEIPFFVVDPKGDWHGIRSSADGKRAGLSVPVFGGLHGDFPLEAGMGKQIADLLVDQMLSAVLDVSMMSKTGELPRFLVAFFDQIMHRHQLDPHVRAAILEEAHRYLPQQVRAEHARLKEAAAALLLEGRAWGLGCWAASQRPARLNKDVLEEVGIVIVHRIGAAATNDLRTIGGWFKHHELSDEISSTLTSLAPGEAWVLDPEHGIIRRVQMERRTTFDSAATPKVGAAARKPTKLADIDAGAIKEALVESIEKAKLDDPKELRKEIKRLEAELAHRGDEYDSKVNARIAELEEEFAALAPVEVPVLSGETLEHLEALLQPHAALLGEVQEVLSVYRRSTGSSSRVGAPPQPASTRVPAPAASSGRAQSASGHGPGTPPGKAPRLAAAGELAKPPPELAAMQAGARRMLHELCQFPGGLKPGILSARAKVKRSGGSWATYLSKLRVAGFIDDSTGIIRATELGLEAGGGAREPMTGDELLDDWRRRLGENNGKRRMLDELVAVYPEALTADELSERTGVDRRGGSWATYLSVLRTNDLMVEIENGLYRASEVFES